MDRLRQLRHRQLQVAVHAPLAVRQPSGHCVEPEHRPAEETRAGLPFKGKAIRLQAQSSLRIRQEIAGDPDGSGPDRPRPGLLPIREQQRQRKLSAGKPVLPAAFADRVEFHLSGDRKSAQLRT